MHLPRKPGDAASIYIDSAEGTSVFPGLGDDAESDLARTFIARRLEEIPEELALGAARRLARRNHP